GWGGGRRPAPPRRLAPQLDLELAELQMKPRVALRCLDELDDPQQIVVGELVVGVPRHYAASPAACARPSSCSAVKACCRSQRFTSAMSRTTPGWVGSRGRAKSTRWISSTRPGRGA